MPPHFMRRYRIVSYPEGAPVDTGGKVGSGMRTGAFAPPTDVCETETGYEIRMEIAGVSPEATEIVIADNNQQVTITGVRYAPRRDPSPKYLNLEIQYGGFARTVALPQAVDRDSAAASYKEGLLVITVEKTKLGERARSVPIEKDL